MASISSRSGSWSLWDQRVAARWVWLWYHPSTSLLALEGPRGLEIRWEWKDNFPINTGQDWTNNNNTIKLLLASRLSFPNRTEHFCSKINYLRASILNLQKLCLIYGSKFEPIPPSEFMTNSRTNYKFTCILHGDMYKISTCFRGAAKFLYTHKTGGQNRIDHKF